MGFRCRPSRLQRAGYARQIRDLLSPVGLTASLRRMALKNPLFAHAGYVRAKRGALPFRAPYLKIPSITLPSVSFISIPSARAKVGASSVRSACSTTAPGRMSGPKAMTVGCGPLSG